MKLSIKIILLTFTMLALVSCSAKKIGNQKFSFKVAALQTGLALNGGSFVRAINASSNTLIKLDANDSAEFEQGVWEFQTVSFEGPGAYAGRRFCGRVVGVNLSDAQKDISLNINEANCYLEPFISLMTLINANFNATNFLTISNISPKSGTVSGGSTVTINGSGFVSGATVSIGGTTCSGMTVANSSTLSCILPSHALGAVTVTITNPDSQTTSAANFFTYKAAPTITNLAPSIGPIGGGTVVTITGTGFVTGATVTFGGTQCVAPVVISATSLACTTPSFPAGPVDVVVKNPDNQISTSSSFYYLPTPVIANVSPNNGPISGGTFITITGTGFTSSPIVYVGGSLCSTITFVNSTQITCNTPAHVFGLFAVAVNSNDGQVSTLNNTFAFNPPPVINSLDKTFGVLAGGEVITITGQGFVSGTTVEIGGTPCVGISVTVPTTITCSTPPNSAGAKTVIVANPDTQFTSYPNFYTYRQPFISTWQTSSPDESITLPLVAGLNYNFIVDWGDGSPINSVTAYTTPTHTYAIAGTYVVTINGLVEGWRFANTGSNFKIKTVENFGDMGWKNLNLAFNGCTNLTSFSGGVTTNVTDMSGMFKGANSLTNLNVSSFNTSNVTNMSYMFYGTNNLLSLNLSNFNTGNVTNMSSMFYGMEKVTSLNVASFNTNMVTDMSSMFGHTNVLPTLDVSTFNTSTVVNMTMMFEQAAGLTTLDLSNFNTSKVTSMGGMFNNANKLTSLNVSNFDTVKVTNMGQMFASLGSLTNIDLSSFNTSSVTSMSSMFSYSTKLASLDLSHFDTSKVTNFNTMFQNTTLLTSLNVTGWDISTLAPTAVGIFDLTNVALQLTCTQSGSVFFTKTCM